MRKKTKVTIGFSILVLVIISSLTILFLNHKPSYEHPDFYEGDVMKYNLENPVLIQYETFDKLQGYLTSSSEKYELLYFGYPDCPVCNAYTPIINEVMYSFNKPILYFNAESLSDIFYDTNGTPSNSKEYQKILDWIMETTDNKALEKKWLKTKTIKSKGSGQEVELLRLYVPRYFLIHDNKIIDCFMTSSAGLRSTDLKNTPLSESEKVVARTIFKIWLNERI